MRAVYSTYPPKPKVTYRQHITNNSPISISSVYQETHYLSVSTLIKSKYDILLEGAMEELGLPSSKSTRRKLKIGLAIVEEMKTQISENKMARSKLARQRRRMLGQIVVK